MNELDFLDDIEQPLLFMSLAIKHVEQLIDLLLHSSFRQDEFATKYALNPLLGHNGPLNELPIKLKLLFGLGIISKECYQDIEQLINLHDRTQENDCLTFLDLKLVGVIKKLHSAKGGMVVEQKFKAAKQKMQKTTASEIEITMQEQRQRDILRSALILVLTTICDELCKKSPLAK